MKRAILILFGCLIMCAAFLPFGCGQESVPGAGGGEQVGVAQEALSCSIDPNCTGNAPAVTCCGPTHGKSCTDTHTDNNNCGACGVVCGSTEHCCSAHCVSKWDNDNCGTCGHVCGNPNGQADNYCNTTLLTCTEFCNSGYGNCDGNDANGCETNLTTSAANCGACGAACALGAHVATESCSGSACHVATCAAGYTDCNGSNSDGCEKNTATDVNNCGTCGNVCPTYAPTCSSGTCACTANTATDVNNCGGCGHVCEAGQTCTAGKCGCSYGVAGAESCGDVGAVCRYNGTKYECTGTVSCTVDNDCIMDSQIFQPGETQCCGGICHYTNGYDSKHCGSCATNCEPSGICCIHSSSATSCESKAACLAESPAGDPAAAY